jgi:single-strand DNA-binding protein
LKKGSLAGVTGRIQTRNYDNQEGKKVYVTEIVAESVQFLEPKNLGNPGTSENRQQQAPKSGGFKNEPPYSGQVDISDDDLPF